MDFNDLDPARSKHFLYCGQVLISALEQLEIIFSGEKTQDIFKDTFTFEEMEELKSPLGNGSEIHQRRRRGRIRLGEEDSITY
jgi:hypothetical protein